MKDTELKKMRDQALYETYIEGLKSGTFSTLNEIAEYARLHPAPQYYIEAKNVSMYIGMIESGVSLINLNSCSRRRAWKLYDEYRSWLRSHPGTNLTRERICELLVDQPAPEFYINKDSARKIIQRKCREVLQSKLKRK